MVESERQERSTSDPFGVWVLQHASAVLLVVSSPAVPHHWLSCSSSLHVHSHVCMFVSLFALPSTGASHAADHDGGAN